MKCDKDNSTYCYILFKFYNKFLKVIILFHCHSIYLYRFFLYEYYILEACIYLRCVSTQLFFFFAEGTGTGKKYKLDYSKRKIRLPFSYGKQLGTYGAGETRTRELELSVHIGQEGSVAQSRKVHEPIRLEYLCYPIDKS